MHSKWAQKTHSDRYLVCFLLTAKLCVSCFTSLWQWRADCKSIFW